MGVSDIETLRSLVDSSLRSPEYGIVNFHHLHKVLHGILTHLGLHYDGSVLSSKNIKATEQISNNNSGVESAVGEREGTQNIDGETVESENNVAKDSRQSLFDDINDKAGEVNTEDQEVEKLKSHQKHLESKISDLEDKLKVLDDLPSNKTIIQEAQQSDSKDSKDSTLSSIWQFMKINRRLQAAEEAIERIMSILNEILGSGEGKNLSSISNSIQDLSTELQQLKDQLKDSLSNRESKHDGSLLKKDEFDKSINGLATKEELKDYVKWPALEEALQVKKDQAKKNNEVNIMRLDDVDDVGRPNVHKRPKSSPAPPTQSPVPQPEVPKTAMATESTQVTAKDFCDNKSEPDDTKAGPDDYKEPHPSPELAECLRHISELHDEYNKMNEVIATKMDKVELNIPPDLQDQLNELKKGFDSLLQNGAKNSASDEEVRNVSLDNKDKIDTLRKELAAMARQAKQTYIERPPAAPVVDNDTLLAIQRKLTDLASTQDNSYDNTEKKIAELLENLNSKQDLIDSLYKQIKTLYDIKADKDNVAQEMEYKADKAALDSKVNTATFDTTFTMLDEGLREALQKMDDYMNEEMALKNALKQLSCDMKEKMDNEAFKAMQNYLEKRIADVQKSRTIIAREAKVDLDNAAGIRRPLPVNFHCISCNRPVDVKYRADVEPSLPKTEGIYSKRSKGPYLTYEIDQLRALNRGQQPPYRPERVNNDAVSISRACGGSHTVTGQQLRRPVRIHNTAGHPFSGSSSKDEQASVSYPRWTREVSIIDFLRGTDGHVYKGRYKTVPPISNHKQTPSESDLPPLRNDPSPPLTGHKWKSEPELSRAFDEIEEKQPTNPHFKAKPLTPPTNTNTHPNSRYKRVINQRISDIETSAVPPPSPPAARENEYQHRISREEFLAKQQQELANERLFSPQKGHHHQHVEQVTSDEKGDPAQQMYSPHSPKMSTSPKSGGKGVIGLSLPNGRMSVDSIDDVAS